MCINPELLELAIAKTGGLYKQADPAAMMGGAPMDPAMAGGMPADPAMMGGGAPQPMMGAPAPGMPQQGMVPGMDPMMGGGMGAMGGKKMKPEEINLTYRLYNIQVQLTALLNHLQIQIPADALLMPPTMAGPPMPEQAFPGGGSPIDQATQGGGQAAGGQAGGPQSAIQPIEPMQPAMPQDGGGGAKMAEHTETPPSVGVGHAPLVQDVAMQAAGMRALTVG